MMGFRRRPSAMMFCSSCCSSSNCSGGILLWNSGSILSWLSFTSVLLTGHFRFTDNGLNVVVKPISCLAIRADILDELPGVGSAEPDALCVQNAPWQTAHKVVRVDSSTFLWSCDSFAYSFSLIYKNAVRGYPRTAFGKGFVWFLLICPRHP